MLRGPVWTAVGLLIAFPTCYFFIHLADPNFRDGAIGNWSGTVVGIIVGVAVALWLAQEQQKMEARTEAKEQVELRKERLRSMGHRVDTRCRSSPEHRFPRRRHHG